MEGHFTPLHHIRTGLSVELSNNEILTASESSEGQSAFQLQDKRSRDEVTDMLETLKKRINNVYLRLCRPSRKFFVKVLSIPNHMYYPL
jgi:hypothetical protein